MELGLPRGTGLNASGCLGRARWALADPAPVSPFLLRCTLAFVPDLQARVECSDENHAPSDSDSFASVAVVDLPGTWPSNTTFPPASSMRRRSSWFTVSNV